MCLAIPMQLLEAAGDEGVVARGEVRQSICMALLPEAEVGDYVLVHAGYAIARVDAAEAEETRRLLAELLSGGDSAEGEQGTEAKGTEAKGTEFKGTVGREPEGKGAGSKGRAQP